MKRQSQGFRSPQDKSDGQYKQRSHWPNKFHLTRSLTRNPTRPVMATYHQCGQRGYFLRICPQLTGAISQSVIGPPQQWYGQQGQPKGRHQQQAQFVQQRNHPPNHSRPIILLTPIALDPAVNALSCYSCPASTTAEAKQQQGQRQQRYKSWMLPWESLCLSRGSYDSRPEVRSQFWFLYLYTY